MLDQIEWQKTMYVANLDWLMRNPPQFDLVELR